ERTRRDTPAPRRFAASRRNRNCDTAPVCPPGSAETTPSLGFYLICATFEPIRCHLLDGSEDAAGPADDRGVSDQTRRLTPRPSPSCLFQRGVNIELSGRILCRAQCRRRAAAFNEQQVAEFGMEQPCLRLDFRWRSPTRLPRRARTIGFTSTRTSKSPAGTRTRRS